MKGPSLLTRVPLALHLLQFVVETSLGSTQNNVVHACKNDMVRLNCRSGVIRIVDVVLAKHRLCVGCCPRDTDCRGAPSSRYRSSVNEACSGQTWCQVDVEVRNIGCGGILSSNNNNYANVTYTCTETATTTKAATTTTTSGIVAVASFNPDFGISARSSSSWNSPSETPGIEAESAASSSSLTSAAATAAAAAADGTSSREEKNEGKHPTTKGMGKGDGEIVAHQVGGNQDDAKSDRLVLVSVTAVVVGGLVLISLVIAGAILIALRRKKRVVIVKTSEEHAMSTLPCTNDTDSIRNYNFYDIIPDSGNSSFSGGEAGENEYLKPMTTEEEERQYVSIK